MNKDEVSAALDEIGTLLALKGENEFKTKAYHNASRTLSQVEGDLAEVIAAGKLKDVRGIGESLREKITTLVTTGKLPYLEELRASVPPGMMEMLRIGGLGPKKIIVLHDQLGIDTIDKLREKCESGEVAKLKGFGEKTQEKILEGVKFLGLVGNRVRVDLATALGEAMLEHIRKLPGVIRAELCGSIRRRRDTAKDLDILVSCKNAAPIMEAFVNSPQVMQVIGHGSTKSSVTAALSIGGHQVVMNADLRAVTDEQFPFALFYFTGSKDHNIRMRQRAIERGLTLNEYALANDTKSVKCRDEKDIYKALDLEYVPPEMREDTGEIEAAEKGPLPKLVEASDIRGIFHNHTLASDGTATLEQMALATKKLGYEYFGVGDHSKSLTVANGLTPERVRAQWAEIDELNKKLKGIQILKGTECDILLDGSLDFDDELLAGFDYVVASVHAHFNLTEEQQTERVCKALSHPATTILGHPTGRLLLRRDGYKMNMEKVLQTAAKHGKVVEINAQPDRLDLEWIHVKRAKSLGVPLVINPDAHSTSDLEFVPLGVDVARRGWLTKADVFNTLNLKEMIKELARRKR